MLERTPEGWRRTDDGERLWFVGASGAIGDADLRAVVRGYPATAVGAGGTIIER